MHCKSKINSILILKILIELILIFLTKSAEQKDGRCRKENGNYTQKELLSSGWCCFACLQEVLVHHPKLLQNAEVQPLCGIASEELRLEEACAPNAT